MPLFADPKTLNDGTVDHVFTFRSQLPDAKSIVGEWVEPAAELSENSKIVVKHDAKGTVKRRLLQRTVSREILDGSLEPITINVTIAHHNEHTSEQIQPEVTIVTNAATDASFVNNFLQGLI